jgi:hypothetical protein
MRTGATFGLLGRVGVEGSETQISVPPPGNVNFT